MEISTENIVFIGSILIFFSIFISKAGYKFGIPLLFIFLCVGMFFGSDGLGINFNSPYVAQFIGSTALSCILFSGGMDTEYKDIKPIIKQGVILAILGVLLTVIITGFIIYFLSGLINNIITLSLAESMLIASLISSTDSASVFSLLKTSNLKLKNNLGPTLELESGSNDPIAYILTLLFINVVQVGSFDFWDSFFMLFKQLFIGIGIGYVFSKIMVIISRKILIENHSLFSILLLSFSFFVFSFTNMIDGNGYLAVYIAGLVIGNNEINHKADVATFFHGFTWLAQIVMFITLGLLVNPGDLLTVAIFGLIIAIVLIFISRPISIFACLIPFKNFDVKDKLFISWVGLRGAVPIIFATYPWLAGIKNASLMFNLIFFITIISMIVQGTTVVSVAKYLKRAE